jgi:hypothetical protein
MIELDFGDGQYFKNKHHGEALEEGFIFRKRLTPQLRKDGYSEWIKWYAQLTKKVLLALLFG